MRLILYISLLVIFSCSLISLSANEVDKPKAFDVSGFFLIGTNHESPNYPYGHLGMRFKSNKTKGMFTMVFDIIHGQKREYFTYFQENDYSYQYSRSALGAGFDFTTFTQKKLKPYLGLHVYTNFFRKKLHTDNLFLQDALHKSASIDKLRLALSFNCSYEINHKSNVMLRSTFHRIEKHLVHPVLFTIGYERRF